MGLTRAGLTIATVFGLACASQSAIEVPPTNAAHELSPAVDPELVERDRQRHAAVARDVAITATLWDGALVAAGLERARRRGDDEDTLDRRRERWTSRYLGAGTSFTVIVELANRHPESEGADPLADPGAWTFALRRSGVGDLLPVAVDVEGIDRFPTSAGGHHLRLAFAVHFAGGPLSDVPREAERLRLRVHTGAAQAGLRRRELGPWVAGRGAALSWWVSPG